MCEPTTALNLPLGKMFRIYMLVQRSHITAMDVKLFSHGGIEERLKYLECCIEDPILVHNVEGGCPYRHGGLKEKNVDILRIHI